MVGHKSLQPAFLFKKSYLPAFTLTGFDHELASAAATDELMSSITGINDGLRMPSRY